MQISGARDACGQEKHALRADELFQAFDRVAQCSAGLRRARLGFLHRHRDRGVEPQVGVPRGGAEQ